MNAYERFLHEKSQLGSANGFDPVFMPDFLFDFQKELVSWNIKVGRSANIADCGLGKTPMGFVWAENVIRHTNGNVLILTPPAVGAQMVEEAEKFDIQVGRSRDDGKVHRGITITNYEQLHKFNPDDFSGVVCDESSILKSFDGKTKSAVTEFMRKTPYRLLQTATAAPNDYIELGTSSEALGYMGHMDMLAKFFKNDMNNCATGRMRGEAIKWRFKGHAELPFWRWVCSWARAMRKPSDLGFDDARFILPLMTEVEHLVEAKTLADGNLFAMPAIGLKEQRDERRRTTKERCELVGSIVDTGEQALVWCHSNDEGDLLEKIIPGALQVAGKHSDDVKEERLIAFARGELRVLVTKPKIGAWGLNFQKCHHSTMFPSHSFEQYYQCVRRIWRFGQENEVRIDMVTTEGESGVVKNMQRKAAQAESMFENLVAEMNNASGLNRVSKFNKKGDVPAWLSSIS
jgi:hypothetical protein